ncbi:hypothetical protein Sros01_83020 [Streptomyces roseochromogenus]|nr:hypothetical protein Sros01_83020 [Streptomyces roseochromogenus]
MDLEIRRHLLVDLGQELLELGGPVPSVEEPMTLPVDFAGGEERGGAGADVVMAAALWNAGHHRQDRLGAVQGAGHPHR